MTGIDDAASAFDADMGGSTHVSSATGSDAPVEQLFRGVGDLENPNEAAGGDDAPSPVFRKLGNSRYAATKKRTKSRKIPMTSTPKSTTARATTRKKTR